RRRSSGWTFGLRVLGGKAKVFDTLLEGTLEGSGRDPARAFAFSLAERLKAGGLYDRILLLEGRKKKGSRPFHLLAALEERIRILEEAGASEKSLRPLKAKRAELLQVCSLPEPGAGELPGRVTLEDLERSLPPSMAVLFFHVGERFSALWVVRRGAARFRRLPGKKALLERLSPFLRAATSLPGYGSWRVSWREGRRALEFLLGGAAAFLEKGGRVAVVPGSGLEDFPFEALVAGPPTPPEDPGGIRFLGPDLGITFTRIPSASLLVHFLSKKKKRGAGKILLVEADHGEDLSFLREELDSIQAAPAGREVIRLRGKRAFLRLRECGRDAALLHLAGHARPGGEDDPPRLTLGGERLSPLDILSWGLGPDFVNLSACRTSLGRPLPLEGRQGFARAFLACGTRLVLSSAWEIQDRAAARFNRVFYANLGKGFSRAFLEAQRNLRKDPAFGAPFYWAPFQLTGTP
ncbi:MAG TPA: CHAT domain-containing protein, partial [Planctomycetes bacterium]|nr:CHAT domain-containing protein [Planctomycetota bacterium]